MSGQYYTNQAIEFALLVTVMGREARSEDYDTILKVGWSIRNRVTSPRYWGHDWVSVITHPEAYTSMVPPPKDKDPNLTVYPDPSNAKWVLIMEAAEAVYWGTGEDPVHGATHYFDHSLDSDPPFWTKARTSEHICDSGNLHFWKVA